MCVMFERLRIYAVVLPDVTGNTLEAVIRSWFLTWQPMKRDKNRPSHLKTDQWKGNRASDMGKNKLSVHTNFCCHKGLI